MHNEYITTCCILNEKKKLLLLKYADIDITQLTKVLQPITLELMNQCYKHLEMFHNLNKQKSKKYSRIEPLIIEQLKDMAFIKDKFIEYFSKSGSKSKEDLFTYVFAFQISEYYYSHYLYSILLESIKECFPSAFWKKHNLNMYELESLGLSDFHILSDTGNECSTGQISINLKPSIAVIEDYVGKNSFPNDKLNAIKKVGNVLDNFYNVEFAKFNNPYKDNLLELIDHTKVSIDLDKPKKLIKRI